MPGTEDILIALFTQLAPKAYPLFQSFIGNIKPLRVLILIR